MALRVHGALLLTQFCWGSAAVVNKLGLSGAGMLPLLFAFVREATAAPLLFAMVCWVRRERRGFDDQIAAAVPTVNGEAAGASVAPAASRRKASPLVLRLLPGFFIFLDQLCSLTGVTLADPLSAAAWQPSQVVFTMMICASLGMEDLTRPKAVAVVLTVAGALCLVFLNGDAHGHAKARSGRSHRAGHVFFLFNCLASSLEVVVWRKLLRHSASPTAHFVVMAESYLVASVLMAGALLAASASPALVGALCPECHGNAFHLPPRALWSVAYAVVFQTIVGYLALAWALRFAEASLTSLYATAQPVMAALVTCLMLAVGFNPGNVLEWPGLEMVGALLIIAGLLAAQLGTKVDSRAGRDGCGGAAADDVSDEALHRLAGATQALHEAPVHEPPPIRTRGRASELANPSTLGAPSAEM